MTAKSIRSEAEKLHRAAMERQRKIKENIGYDALQRKLDHRLEEKATKKIIVLEAVAYIQELQDLLKRTDSAHLSPAPTRVFASTHDCALLPEQSFETAPALQQCPEEPGFGNWFPAPLQHFQQLEDDFGLAGSIHNPIQSVPTPRGIKRAMEQESCYDGPITKRPSLVAPTPMIVKHGHLFDETTGYYHLGGSVPVSNDAPQYYGSTNYTNTTPQMHDCQY